MNRDALTDLMTWKQSRRRKPLQIRGARQVGKTWLVREHAKTYPSVIELNLEENPRNRHLFEQDLDPLHILRGIEDLTQKPCIPGETLLFLDEIQAQPKAYAALRFFKEKLPAQHIIATGSYLHAAESQVPTGVGRLNLLSVYPLTFSEYLSAMGRERLRDRILRQPLDQPISPPIHELLLDLLKGYLFVGGMPEAVSAYRETGVLTRAREVHVDLLDAFRSDFVKYAAKHRVKYLERLLTGVPEQMGSQFKHSLVFPDSHAREMAPALDLFHSIGLAHLVKRTNATRSPVRAGVKHHRHKVLFLDIGLALAVLQANPADWLVEGPVDLINGGAVAEAFVGQELAAYTRANPTFPLMFWRRDKKGSDAEVDYLLEGSGGVLPVEVKRGPRGRLRSLSAFLDRGNHSLGVITSSRPFGRSGGIQSIPLYALERLFRGPDHLV